MCIHTSRGTEHDLVYNDYSYYNNTEHLLHFLYLYFKNLVSVEDVLLYMSRIEFGNNL